MTSQVFMLVAIVGAPAVAEITRGGSPEQPLTLRVLLDRVTIGPY